MLNGKVAIITGCAGHIGEAIAEKIGLEGANLVVSDINFKKLNTKVKKLLALNIKCIAVVADVTKRSDTVRLVEKAIEEYGKVDILVNVAGGPKNASILDMTEEDWEYVFNLNLKGTFNCIQAIVKHFIHQGSGKIVNISSKAKDGVPWYSQAGVGRSNYASAKAGLDGLTRSLALELAPYNININNVVAGPIMTPDVQEEFNRLENDANVKASPLTIIPLKRYGTPEDVAGAVKFLVSKDADYITGHSLYVTGGI